MLPVRVTQDRTKSIFCIIYRLQTHARVLVYAELYP